jgi:CheY-like chemotaxis protein
MRKGPILVVEDVPNVLELLEVTLRFKGYQVVSARNGLEGLEMVEKAQPAMVITDILMPHLDGFAFIQTLRTSNSDSKHIPVIFLSATYVTPEDKRFAMSLGAARFIEKPIDTEDFLLTIAEIMAQENFTLPEPLNMLDFYNGYRERLEQKLRNKNNQISRTERVIPGLPEEQRAAFQSMLSAAENDRDDIQAELQEVQRQLGNLKTTGQ